MKNYRNAIAVMLLLASPVFAGIMQTGATEPAPIPITVIALDLLHALLF